MWYKLKRILIYPDGVTEKQVYPKYEWKPDASRTLLYLPLESNATDQSWNSRSTSATNVSYTTVWWLASASIPSNWYITIPDNMVSYSTSEMTVSCLLYTTTAQSSTRRCILWMLKNWVSWNAIQYAENNTVLWNFIWWDSLWLDTSKPINEWFHIVVTCDSSSHNMYLNWVKVATWTWSTRPRWTKSNTTNDACRIGNGNTWSQWLAGNMREMILEKKKRSDEDVSKYYQRIKSKLWI